MHINHIFSMFILTSTSLVKEAFNTGLELSGRMEIKSIRDIFDDAAITHGIQILNKFINRSTNGPDV